VANAVSISQINLTWADNSTNETGFRVEQALVSSGPWTQIADLAANNTSLGNTGLSANTMYYYRVYAYNSCGNSAYTNVASVVTLLPPPANAATNMTSSSFTANWGSGSTGTTGYLLDVATNSSFTSYVSGYQNLNVGNVQNRNVSGLGAGTYYYRLQSYSLVGASADSNVVSATTVVTSTPTPTPAPTPSSSPWSKAFGSTSNDAGQGVAFDSSGNMYATGYFQGTVNFGCGSLSSNGTSYPDAFLTKYSSTGVCLWSKSFGGGLDDKGYSVAVDSSDNVIVVGYFGGTADFGGGPVTGQRGYNIFVAKYAADGTYQWAKTFGSSSGGSNIAYGVAVDSGGNVAITGTFQNTVDFGGGPITAAGLYRGIFVVKLSASGVHLWSKGFGGVYDDYGWGVAFDANGNLVVTGQFQDSVDFGGGTLTPSGGDDIFLVKYSPNGSHIWSKRFGDTANQEALAIAMDSSGNIVIVGSLMGTVDFGGGPLTDPSTFYPDMFVAKLSSAGDQVWSKRFGGSNSDQARGVAIDSSGNVIITGYIFGAVDFGGGPLSNTGLSTFVAKYSGSGVYLWSRAFPGTASNQGNAAAIDRNGNVGATGWLQGTVDFGQGSISSAGGLDGFVLKLGP
jgi:hypothetical protein